MLVDCGPINPPTNRRNPNQQALLLVFRTNGAYQRWYEARCVFGRISDAARDIYRQVLAGACVGVRGGGA